MESSWDFPIHRFEHGELSEIKDPVITEMRVVLDVNDGALRFAMLCLPCDIEALAVGFLIGEGALARIEDLESVTYFPPEQTLYARGNFDEEVLSNMTLRWTWGTGCGGGGTSRDMESPGLAPIESQMTVSPEALIELSEVFYKKTGLWRRTGGAHACALTDGKDILLFAEDVGRHNAFDKIIGKAAMDGIDTSDKIVLTTGRLSGEIISKTVACRVPILASRSAVTSLAVKLSHKAGLTVVGFLRGKRFNVYNGDARITG